MVRKAFLRNVDLTAEIVACQQNNEVSPKLARMLMLMVERYATKPNWRFYSYVEDMKCDALYQLIKTNDHGPDRRPNVLKFSLEYSARTGKPPNPFSYVTQIICNAFRRRVKLEGALGNFRDDCLIEAGLTPSARRQYEDECAWSAEPIPPRKSGAGRPSKAPPT